MTNLKGKNHFLLKLFKIQSFQLNLHTSGSPCYRNIWYDVNFSNRRHAPAVKIHKGVSSSHSHSLEGAPKKVARAEISQESYGIHISWSQEQRRVESDFRFHAMFRFPLQSQSAHRSHRPANLLAEHLFSISFLEYSNNSIRSGN